MKILMFSCYAYQKLFSREMWNFLNRKKTMDRTSMEQSELRRTLGLIDLTTIGIANTFGLGAYVLAGKEARIAGPAICVSHFIVGIVTTITALCYGELAAAVPRSGSVYSYTYVLMGEFMASIFGWLQCMENIIGLAYLSRGLGTYFYNMADYKPTDYFVKLNIPVSLTGHKVCAVLLISICNCIVAGGVELTVMFEKLFTFLNLTTLTIIIIIGVCNADTHNWSWQTGDENFPTDGSGGSGGFFPFGFHGVMETARQSVYAYRGFEGISCAGEETINPRKLLPLAILLTLIIASVSYIGVAVALTLMWPYFDESEVSPFAHALEMSNMHNLKWVVSTGIFFCLCACLLGCTYTSSRALYSVGADGLIFKWFGMVNAKTKTPIVSNFFTALFSGCLVFIFDSNGLLITMVSVSNLVSHGVVAVCVLLLRYKVKDEDASQNAECWPENGPRLLELLNLKRQSKAPTNQSYFAVKMIIIVLIMSCSLFSVILLDEQISNFEKPLAIMIFALIIFCIVALTRQPQCTDDLSFKVPFVPLLPVASLFVNIFLVMSMILTEMVWLIFIIAIILGLLFYFGYGMRNSKEANKEDTCNYTSS